MKKAIILAREKAEHQISFGGSFARGLVRHGWKAEVATEPAKCDLLVMWGTRRTDRIQRQINMSGEVCILERGYVGDRFVWTSVSFGGGLNGRAEFRGPFDDASRWNEYHADLMKPWKEDPFGYALIMEQVPGDKSIQGVDMQAFYANARHAFARTGVKFRPHPNASPGKGEAYIAKAARSLQDDLAGAAVAITYNSNSAVDAVLAGVPAIALDRGSMAWDVSHHELSFPRSRPDRSAWAHALAWKQWRKDEMESGYCWEIVGKI